MAGVSKKGVKGFQSVEEGSVHTGTEAWNIAQYFTGYSIALPLKDLNDLEIIARFGTVKIDDELAMTDDQYDKRRADAVKRYWLMLRQIVADTFFKIKAKDREETTKIHEFLKTVPQYFNALLTLKTNSLDHDDKIEVNEKFLTILMNELVQKKQEYLYILDRAGLIFREMDGDNLDRFMNDFVHGG